MKTLLVLAGVVLLVSTFAAAQKPWSEWDKKEVDKILNGSAWGQTQTETDTSQMTFRPTTDKEPLSVDGARNQSVDLKYRIRMFSAKPVREAFARSVMMANPTVKPEQLKNFIDSDYSEMIVVAVAVESADRRYLGPANQRFAVATTETLKNSAYIERGDGKRLFIDEYARPTTDGTGAKFVFPRVVDGKPWLGPGDHLRFVADLGGGTKVSWRFNLSDMMYSGKLEY